MSSPGGGILTSVTAISARDAWAVGYRGDSSPRAVIMHWNGSAWKNVPTPRGSDLFGVAAISARSAWAVGGTPSKTLIIRWNGSAWK